MLFFARFVGQRSVVHGVEEPQTNWDAPKKSVKKSVEPPSTKRGQKLAPESVKICQSALSSTNWFQLLYVF